MRILYVTDALAIWGGLERILVEKINLLAEMYDYDMHVVTVNQGDHPLPFPLNHKVHYQDLNIMFHHRYRYKGIKRWLKDHELHKLYRQKLRAYVDTYRPDVIVSARADLVPAILQAKGHIPMVFESHVSRWGQRFNDCGFFAVMMSEWHNRSVRHADCVVALTQGDAADWYSLNPRVHVIPNVVHLNDSGEYSTVSNKSVIFVGRFSHQKDIDSLVKIWQFVNSRHPDWQLHMFGGFGDEQQRVQVLIDKLSINIAVHDPTRDIFSRYKESSILVLTSRFEPFGLVLPEAMSCGLPVVAFDCPYGPAEIIIDGKDGFLIRNRNIEEFASKVCLLIENPDMRIKMGHAGIESSKRYDTACIMPQWKQFFEQLIN